MGYSWDSFDQEKRRQEIAALIKKTDTLVELVLNNTRLDINAAFYSNKYRIKFAEMRKGALQLIDWRILQDVPMIIINPGDMVASTTKIDNEYVMLGRPCGVAYHDGLWRVITPSIGNHHVGELGTARIITELMAFNDYDYLRPDYPLWNRIPSYLNPLWDFMKNIPST